MDPDLAQKYEKGGAVGSCRGMGAAMRGGKFSGEVMADKLELLIQRLTS